MSPHLAAGFGIERSSVQHDSNDIAMPHFRHFIDELFFGDDADHFSRRGSRFVAEKFRVAGGFANGVERTFRHD